MKAKLILLIFAIISMALIEAGKNILTQNNYKYFSCISFLSINRYFVFLSNIFGQFKNRKKNLGQQDKRGKRHYCETINMKI
jgi:hypothetical protein